jgi:hypothetical protein
MHLTTMPSALLSQILRTQDLRQKQVVAGDRGRSPMKYLVITFLVFALVGCASTPDLQDFEKLRPSAFTVLGQDFVIRGWSFTLVPSKPNYFAVTILYSTKLTDTPRKTILLREGDFFPATLDFVVKRISTKIETIGTPETGIAGLVIRDVIIQHRKSGIRFLLRDEGSQYLSVQKL